MNYEVYRNLCRLLISSLDLFYLVLSIMLKMTKLSLKTIRCSQRKNLRYAWLFFNIIHDSVNSVNSTNSMNCVEFYLSFHDGLEF